MSISSLNHSIYSHILWIWAKLKFRSNAHRLKLVYVRDAFKNENENADSSWFVNCCHRFGFHHHWENGVYGFIDIDCLNRLDCIDYQMFRVPLLLVHLPWAHCETGIGSECTDVKIIISNGFGHGFHFEYFYWVQWTMCSYFFQK